MKKFITIIFAVYSLISTVSAFTVIDSANTPSKLSYLKINFTPFEKENNCEAFLNDGAPVKVIMQDQEYHYFKNDDNQIKIEIRFDYNSAYKSKTYFFNQKDNASIYQVKLNKKYNHSEKIADLIIKSLNSYIKYNETKNIEDFKTATNSFGALYYLPEFFDEFSSLDLEDKNTFFNVIKNNISLPNENYNLITVKIIESLTELNKIIFDASDLRKKDFTPVQQKKKVEELTNHFNKIIWNTFDVIKAVKQQKTDELKGNI